MQKDIHQVIIIGCGISGIGASQILFNNQIEHIILQARNRIGGRVVSQSLDGVWVDMGAMIVHHPNQNNRIKETIEAIGWKSYNKKYTQKQIMVGCNKQIEQNIQYRGYELYRQILYQLQKTAQKSQRDMSFLQAMTIHLKQYEETESKDVMNFIHTLLRIHGNIEGTQLENISGRDLYVDDQSDVIPEKGYAKLVQKIYNFHQRTVFFQEKVCQINYQNDIIEVKTNKNVYWAKKVISSLPLGVLKAKSVNFIPQLPQSHLKSIDNIGVSIFNKIQVSFTQLFWDVSKQYILLVSYNNSKYYRIRSIIQNNQYILCVYVSGNASIQLSKLNDEQIVNDFVNYLKSFYSKHQIKVKNYIITRWHQDQYSLGSYSFYQVGKTTVEDIYELKKPIEEKIWFIGQHCAPQMTGTVNAAFISGMNAAKQVVATLKKGKETL